MAFETIKLGRMILPQRSLSMGSMTLLAQCYFVF